jgi:hypothetical protein
MWRVSARVTGKGFHGDVDMLDELPYKLKKKDSR